jgi:hypothetical protein
MRSMRDACADKGSRPGHEYDLTADLRPLLIRRHAEQGTSDLSPCPRVHFRRWDGSQSRRHPGTPSAPASKSDDLATSEQESGRTTGRTRRVVPSLAPGGPILVAENPSGWSHGRGRRHEGVHAPAAKLSKARQDPSRPSVTAGQPHPASCLADVHKDDLDCTCPAMEMAAIGSMNASGQDGLTLKRQCGIPCRSCMHLHTARSARVIPRTSPMRHLVN